MFQDVRELDSLIDCNTGETRLVQLCVPTETEMPGRQSYAVIQFTPYPINTVTSVSRQIELYTGSR